MTSERLKQLFLEGGDVTYEDRVYRLTGIIYHRGKRGEVIVSAELTDRYANPSSLIICRAKDIAES